ncbi:MAG: RNA polymerase sigma factor [Dyadobacter fermentans]
MEQVSHADTTLWNAIKDGEKAALGELYERYYRQLYRYGTRLLSDTDVIEDTIQDLFINIWHTRHKLPEVRNVKSYLFTIVRREILHKLKKEQSFTDVETLSDLLSLGEESSYEHDDYEKWLVDKLKHTLQTLPKRQLDVIILRYYENFPTSEIAMIMGITEKSVRNTLHKAISHLRVSIPHFDYLLVLLPCLDLM